MLMKYCTICSKPFNLIEQCLQNVLCFIVHQVLQSIQNLFERIVQRFKTLCTIFVNEVVQVVQVVRIGTELQHCTSCTTFCTIL